MRRIAIVVLGAIVTSILATVAVVAPSVAPAAAAPLAGASRLVPVAPARVLDTRSGVGAAGPVAPNGIVTITMPGRGGVPVSGATAVLLNVTVTDTWGPGFVQVFPTGRAGIGTSSNLNVEFAGQTIPNLVVAPLGDVGQISIFVQGGGHVIADVFGWFGQTEQSTDGRYVPVFPNRLLDTRAQAPGKLGMGASVRVPVAGRSGVPVGGASAVVLNVTATDAPEAGFLQVLPTAGASFGAFSNLNLRPGQTVPNLVVVPLGADGSVTVYAERGAHVIVDVFGWFTNQTADLSNEGLFVPLAPTRVHDSRSGPRPAGGSVTRIEPGGRGDVPATGVSAVFGNLTVTDAGGAGFVQVAPGPASAAPLGFWSNANVDRPGQTIPNAAIANLGSDRSLLLYTSNAAHLLYDVSGYFIGAGSVTSTASNRAPITYPIERSVVAGEAVDIHVPDAATDLDGDPITIASFTQPGDGYVVQLSPTMLRYQSYAGASRTASFGITVTDGRGGIASTTATVYINTGTVPDAPTGIGIRAVSWSNPDYGTSGSYRTATAVHDVWWTDNSWNEAGFHLYVVYSVYGIPQSRTLVGTVPAGQNWAQVPTTGFTAHHMWHSIEVTAFNSAGESLGTRAQIFAPRPNAPTVTSLTRLDSSRTQINWTAEPAIGFRPSFFRLSGSASSVFGPSNYSLVIEWNGIGSYSAVLTSTANPLCVSMAAHYLDDPTYSGLGPESATVCASTGGGNGGSDPTTRTFQAEEGRLTGTPPPSQSTENPGYGGWGYVGNFGVVGQAVSFSVTNVGAYRPHLLHFRVRTVEANVQRRIWLNGVVMGTVTLPRTATAWTQNSWVEVTVPITAWMVQGLNTIEMEYVGPGYVGYVDVDSMTVTRA